MNKWLKILFSTLLLLAIYFLWILGGMFFAGLGMDPALSYVIKQLSKSGFIGAIASTILIIFYLNIKRFGELKLFKSTGLFVVSLLIFSTIAYIFTPNDFTEYKSLRGSFWKTADGQTYLTIADNNGGACEKIVVDGKAWPHKINETGPVVPGSHKITCGGEIEFKIPKGVSFRFNYWGP